MRVLSLKKKGVPKLLISVLLSGITLGITTAQVNASPPATTQKVMTLDQAIQIALEYDAWQPSNQFSQQALLSDSVAAGALPNPKLTAALANIPTDSFDFNQEAMTQLVVGISQMFPRGDTLSLKQQQMQQMSEQYPYMREERRARVVLNVTQLWMDAYKARQSIALIQKDRALFDQLVDVSLASYSSAVGRTQQQDVVRAELERTRLEDRLTQLQQQQEMQEQQLGEWLRPVTTVHMKSGPVWASQWASSWGSADRFGLPAESSVDSLVALPKIEILEPALSGLSQAPDDQMLAEYFVLHPVVLQLDKVLDTKVTEVELAEQKYKPEWGVSANYGYRGSDASGRERADLLSVGVTLDIPLFSTVKEDHAVKSAVARSEAIKIDRHLLLRQMISAFNTAKAQQVRLDQREQLFTTRLLPQMHQQAQAALNAYRADNGDFSEVVRARIAELNAKIDALSIAVDQQKVVAQINYLLTQHIEQPSAVNMDKSMPLIQTGVEK